MKGKPATSAKAWVSDTKIYGRIKLVKSIKHKLITGPNFTFEETEKAMGRALEGNLKDMFLMILQNQLVLQFRLKKILRIVKQIKDDQ